MPVTSRLTPEDVATIRRSLDAGTSRRAVARQFGVSSDTVVRALARTPKRVRTAAEFTAPAVNAPRRARPITCWPLSEIVAARDDQLAGHFRRPVALAKAMRCDDAMFTAYHTRLSPHDAIATRLVPYAGARGEAVLARAHAGAFVSRTTLKGIYGELVDHGIAIGYVQQIPADDGSRIDFKLVHWPLECVRYNTSLEVLETATRNGPIVQIEHGNGRWVVFRKVEIQPWTQDACVLPGAVIYASHADGVSDWAGASRSHGTPKVVGSLPENVPLQRLNAAGDAAELTPEAALYLDMLVQMMSGESSVGLEAFGCKTDLLSNNSTAYQVFSELILDRKKAAAFVYLGTDASLGAAGGAPGVDIATLFGVGVTRVQGDFGAIEQALNTGFFQPWCAVNEGTSQYAPRFEYQMPDVDAEAQSVQKSARRTRLATAIKELKDSGAIVDQETVDALAAEHGVSPVPQLASGDVKAVSLPLAPTDIAKIVRVGPALRSIGLEPFGDERDNMTITELDEAVKAKAAAGQAAAEASSQAAADIRVQQAAASKLVALHKLCGLA